ncbi:conserved Plasmodium protein, unknown function [Plasmodium vinckei vinckei]|uniref:Uncharacterized protein n=1 Tax=Plasmodium vinckei vinckei TaxID=54757 RepID=A0A449BT24_PLAVN|nr:conserved Plasmodium protein, unknown function [Plasmodium vinckei vinckei]KEG02248.1 hypothetical protein YYE_02987 [Plasmodium vinckei vinckei]VEV56489.1 conserved Plasmodium protein, unknown function [Plasmodium vinckei vinckei]
MEIKGNNNNLEKETNFEINNINRIILDILCTEAIRKIKFILHILKEILKKKTNVLHVYITNNIDHLSTEKKRKEIFNSLQDQIELCENENDYNNIKDKIQEYINSINETNEILCQNSPVDRNIKENRDKIIEDGHLLLKIFKKIKKLDFISVLNELSIFKNDENLLLNLNQNVYHKKQIINILKKQIEELIENTNNKKVKIYEKIEQVEKKKKIFFVKSMLYYIYKKEYVQANVSNFNMDVKFKHDSTQTSKDNMETELTTYYDINEYIKMFLNKRNDNLQNIHDSLVEYYEKEKIKKIKELEEIKKKVDISILIIQQKKEIILKYEQANKAQIEEEKVKLRKEIATKEYLKTYNECVLFLQDIGRNKIRAYEERRKKLMKKKQKPKNTISYRM